LHCGLYLAGPQMCVPDDKRVRADVGYGVAGQRAQVHVPRCAACCYFLGWGVAKRGEEMHSPGCGWQGYVVS